VACVEVLTGVVCLPDGRRAAAQDDPWQLFESHEEALVFAESLVSSLPELECVVRRSETDEIQRIRNEEAVSDVIASMTEQRRKSRASVIRRLRERLRRWRQPKT
jgi:hypothetical protein